jgi:hypothetical protein
MAEVFLVAMKQRMMTGTGMGSRLRDVICSFAIFCAEPDWLIAKQWAKQSIASISFVLRGGHALLPEEHF